MSRLVSIIIPCFNDYEYIEACIDSVRNQTYSNIEIIVIDDGSDQTTKEKLNTIRPKIDVLITQKNQGQAKARNEGIKKAKGEIICPIDSDDTIDCSFLEKTVNYLKGDVRVVGTCLNLINEKNNKIDIFVPAGGDYKDFLFKNAISGPGVLYRKDDVLTISGYDESMKAGWEDWDFNLRLMCLGGRTHIVNEPLYNYLKRQQSTTSKANTKKNELFKFMYLKHQELYKQHFDEFVVHVISNYNQLAKNNWKVKKSKEFKIGFIVMKPFRFMKRLIK
jgi:glycosyltransferase involved in cell wall biosynthesis